MLEALLMIPHTAFQLFFSVVVRLGSDIDFSDDLIKLQKEVIPIQKSPSCHHKKTTMERFFKDYGFTLDWCYFRLVNIFFNKLHSTAIFYDFFLD